VPSCAVIADSAAGLFHQTCNSTSQHTHNNNHNSRSQSLNYRYCSGSFQQYPSLVGSDLQGVIHLSTTPQPSSLIPHIRCSTQTLLRCFRSQMLDPATPPCPSPTLQRSITTKTNTSLSRHTVNNLCPAQGNPLCAQNGLTGTNQYGANVNFDLCSDSGASGAFFGNSGVGLAVGTATEVPCSEYSGTIVH
jgi:hypothetical protein